LRVRKAEISRAQNNELRSIAPAALSAVAQHDLGATNCILAATRSESLSLMKTVKTYSTRVDAEVAKITLAAAGVPAVVVGIGTAWREVLPVCSYSLKTRMSKRRSERSSVHEATAQMLGPHGRRLM
jgi:hypothetical protein